MCACIISNETHVWPKNITQANNSWKCTATTNEFYGNMHVFFGGKFNLCPSLKRMMFLGCFKWYYHIKDTFNGTSNGICHCFEVHTKAQFDRSAPLNFLTKGDNKQLLIHFLFIFLLWTMRCHFTTFSVISGASCTLHIPSTGSNLTAQVITITMKMAI